MSDHIFEYAQEYLDRLEIQSNTMRIIGMREPKSVRQIFIKVNILEKITSNIFVPLDQLEDQYNKDKKSFGHVKETIDGFDLVDKVNKFIVLGKPGAGKTTYLRAIILRAIDGKFQKKLIPIFVSLKEFSDSRKTLLKFIIEQFNDSKLNDTENFVKDILKYGLGLILLDGLDEVSKERIEFTAREIKSLSQKYPKNQFIISCRIAAFNYIFENFTDVEIADFNDEQIQHFIDNWFGNKREIAKECWKKVGKSKYTGIKELASSPLLLSLICITYSKSDFPSSRTKLYREGIEALLEKWDDSRHIDRGKIYKGFNLEEKHRLFRHIAYSNFEKDKYFLRQEELLDMISEIVTKIVNNGQEDVMLNSKIILNSVIAQHGLLVPRADEVYSFSHLSFQEYFTAMYVVNETQPEDQKAFIQRYFGERKWEEVCLMCTEMHLQAGDFLLSIKKHIDQYAHKNNLIRLLFKVNRLASNYFKSASEVEGRARFIYEICKDSSRSISFDPAYNLYSFVYKLSNTNSDVNFHTEVLSDDFKFDPSQASSDFRFELERKHTLKRRDKLEYKIKLVHKRILELEDKLERKREFKRKLELRSKFGSKDKFGKKIETEVKSILKLETRIENIYKFKDKLKRKLEFENERKLKRKAKLEHKIKLERLHNFNHARKLIRTLDTKLNEYLLLNILLIQCLNTKNNVSKETKEKILNELLIVPSFQKKWWQFWGK